MLKKKWMIGVLAGALAAGGFSYNAFAKENNSQVTQNGVSSGALSEKEAAEIAKTVVDGTVDDIDKEMYDGKEAFEVEIEKAGDDYDVYVDINTTKPLNDPLKEKEEQVSLTKEEAEKIALKQTNGTVIESKLDEDDGVYIYEIEIKTDQGTEAEFDISAKDGRIIKQELDD
ncbi:PepSY domain-containing protein [Bacillus atrophaeus]|uniref:PepSY domain-containing protein n=1 Tax=Bacillus atrophaeus TaxID=1452 RepID=UPI002E1FCB0B|nr:PepSY domain-containing protein [Bacillus atrophaeus]MED1029616.1 PepSY domain-containing protein [Bacillus atrophaeus]MED1117668.1 PepSY domain-containing protein [Bacillus atrophaeus]MED1131440.1 PepSY domain-containing protein [Bacillus atrophaeus]